MMESRMDDNIRTASLFLPFANQVEYRFYRQFLQTLTQRQSWKRYSHFPHRISHFFWWPLIYNCSLHHCCNHWGKYWCQESLAQIKNIGCALMSMAKSGMSHKTLQHSMGHADNRITRDTCTHVKFDDAKDERLRVANAENCPLVKRLSLPTPVPILQETT